MRDATPNAEEADYWSGPSGLTWIENEAEQDRLLGEVNDVVLTHAQIGAGGRVVDIGSGTGALTIAAAEAVGPGGAVLATDISPPLLARTAERTRHLPQVTTFNADTQTADWPPPPADAAISRYGVMFFSDPTAAFANIARALRPGGRMAFAAWAPAAENPWWRLPHRIAAERLGAPPPVPPNTPGPMGLADADWALDHFRAAGLADAACETVTVPLIHDGGARGAADLALRVGPAARVLRLMGGREADRDAIRAALEAAFAPYETAGQARIPARVHLYTARRA